MKIFYNFIDFTKSKNNKNNHNILTFNLPLNNKKNTNKY